VRHGSQPSTLRVNYIWNHTSGFVAFTLLYDRNLQLCIQCAEEAMKKVLMICITATVMMAPLAAYARPGRVFVAPAFGWGWYSPYWGPYPYPYGYYDYAPATGAVKFDTSVKEQRCTSMALTPARSEN
jgi:hypothetical protein